MHGESNRLDQRQRLPLDHPSGQPESQDERFTPPQKENGSEAMYLGIGGLIILIIILYIIFR